MRSHRPSLGFRCVLGGLAVTILSWFSPWLWPAWPAFAALDLAFSDTHPFSALSLTARSIVVILLIALNTAAWAAAFFLLSRIVTGTKSRFRRNQEAGQ